MILDDVKTVLRVTHDFLDSEIIDLIDAAKADLINAGIKVNKVDDDNDKLVKRAIMVYVKSQFGYDNPEADRFQRSFDEIKLRMSITPGYLEDES
jgi:uncharacterized phage protein (predicted DNA packaging)